MKLKKPYILFMLEPFMLEPFMLEPPRPSRLEALFELSDIQATSEKGCGRLRSINLAAIHPTVKTVGFLAESYVKLVGHYRVLIASFI
jgi:hypothetical protein